MNGTNLPCQLAQAVGSPPRATHCARPNSPSSSGHGSAAVGDREDRTRGPGQSV